MEASNPTAGEKMKTVCNQENGSFSEALVVGQFEIKNWTL